MRPGDTGKADSRWRCKTDGAGVDAPQPRARGPALTPRTIFVQDCRRSTARNMQSRQFAARPRYFSPGSTPAAASAAWERHMSQQKNTVIAVLRGRT